jgi:hypothetical protein
VWPNLVPRIFLWECVTVCFNAVLSLICTKTG